MAGLKFWFKKRRRKLTLGEAKVLGMIQDMYGSQNTEHEVFFTDKGEAVIFVKAQDGSSPIGVVLTNLAAWRQDGTITSDEDLRNEWLRVPNGN